jgi:two-component system KDP operon response regulator KdpE
MDGTEIIAAVRARSSTPIIVLSARGAEQEKVRALNLGADDYLTKPFGVDELLARVRVALRHSARPSSGNEALYRNGDLEVDFERRRVSIRGAEIHLTPIEYDLLKAFIASPGKVLTDTMLLSRVWGPEYGADSHYLHVYIARLRKKLEPDAGSRRMILNEPGVGYRFNPVES